MNKGLKKNILVSVFIALAVILILIFASDFHQVVYLISNFPFSTLVLVLIISLFVLFLKFMRWHFYVKLLHLPITLRDSFLYFTASLIMSISPGKWGEIIKSYFIKLDYNIKISRTLPIVFAERITEFLALIIVGLAGIILYNKSFLMAFISLVFATLVSVIFVNKKFYSILISFFSKLPFLKKYSASINEIVNNSSPLFNLKSYFFMIFLSIIAWIFESFGFYIILSNFIIDISVFWTTANYVTSILFGAISMLPGGIGATEGSLTFLLVSKGISISDSAASVILMRFFTLWLSVIFGFIGLMIFLKTKKLKLGELKLTGELNSELKRNKTELE